MSNSTSEKASDKAERASNSKTFETVARVGYAMNGVLHLIIGVLAVRLAFGGSSGDSADQTGALSSIAEQPFGQVLLWIGALGLAVLGLEQLAEAVWGGPDRDDEDTSKRARFSASRAAKGVVYLAVAWTTSTFARGSSSNSNQQSKDVTAFLLQSTFGRIVLFVVALTILGVGGYFIYKGASKKFLEDLEGGKTGTLGHAVVVLGLVGYIAKGVAVVGVGLLFGLAAVQADPSEASGLDGALQKLRDAPTGPYLLAAIGIGFFAFGLYSFARARHAKM